MSFLRAKRFRDTPHRERNDRRMRTRIRRKDEGIKHLLNWMAIRKERGG
jgi:hypothetical protein